MHKILYAPRPIESRAFSGTYELIGYIVDRVYLQSKQTTYNNNEPQKTYYVGGFESYNGSSPICHNQTVKLSPDQVVDSYEECAKIVSKLNEDFAKSVRGYHSVETLKDAENLIASYKKVLNDAQQQATDSWTAQYS